MKPVLGKRYIDKPTGLEALRVSPGGGSLTCNGVLMLHRRAFSGEAHGVDEA